MLVCWYLGWFVDLWWFELRGNVEWGVVVCLVLVVYVSKIEERTTRQDKALGISWSFRLWCRLIFMSQECRIQEDSSGFVARQVVSIMSWWRRVPGVLANDVDLQGSPLTRQQISSAVELLLLIWFIYLIVFGPWLEHGMWDSPGFERRVWTFISFWIVEWESRWALATSCLGFGGMVGSKL